MSEPLLVVDGLDAYYGQAHVLQSVRFSVDEQAVAIVGRNGMGKTTLCAAIMGITPPRATGSVRFEGHELIRAPSYKIARLGIGYVPQGRRLFGDLTVEENLRIGQMVRGTRRDTVDWALSLFPILLERMPQRSRNLSGGEQQMLAVARALCAEPKVLLMDEPTEGLMPSMISKMIDTIAAVRDRSAAVLLVEQKVEVALAVADRIVFLDNGTITGATTPDDLHADAAPLHRHLGVGTRA
jgi:branched-chain amino acid transport system ATP-binding protein